MSEIEKNEEISQGPRYVNIAEYARRCGVSPSAITKRLGDSYGNPEKGVLPKIEKGDPRFLELCNVLNVEGQFIDTKIFPPQKFKCGVKKKNI